MAKSKEQWLYKADGGPPGDKHTISHMHETAGTMANLTTRARSPSRVQEISKSA